eukprot:TRINITY_DN108522_c0_g1_i1.p1 TRINITY_DN108522_c0_g1~~TRINITY_DN108522_c0_g1_i1.p1  ORF type:complete len:243 (-),score=67.29 TRINITY_DN108522_c0_g1_i1:149-877(-)
MKAPGLGPHSLLEALLQRHRTPVLRTAFQSAKEVDATVAEVDSQFDRAVPNVEELSKNLDSSVTGEAGAEEVHNVGNKDAAFCKEGCHLPENTGGPWAREGRGFPRDGGAGGAGGGEREVQVPQAWKDAEAAEESERLAEDLVAKEAKRTGRSFEDVANDDTDDIADDENAFKPRLSYTYHSKQLIPPGSTDRWGGPAMQSFHSLNGVSISGADWRLTCLAGMAPEAVPRSRQRQARAASFL